MHGKHKAMRNIQAVMISGDSLLITQPFFNALVNIRQRLTKYSKRKGLVSAQAEVDKLLIASLTSQDKFIKQLIALHGDKKIETINLRSEDEKITM